MLIAGCGYVGTAAARLFLAAGCAVEGWTRSGKLPEDSGDVASRAVDFADEARIKTAPGNFDVVIHAASTRGGDAPAYRRLYLDGIQNLRAQFPSARFIFVSSTSVYAQNSGEWVDEQSPAVPAHERGEILRKAEEVALSAGGSVARFAGIYGPGRSVLLSRVLENTAPRDLQPDRFVNQVHRDDAAAALCLLAVKGDLARGIWNVADDHPLLLSECYRWLAAQLKRELGSAAPALAAGRKRGNSNKRVKNSKLRGLGWVPEFPSFKEGAERTILPSL